MTNFNLSDVRIFLCLTPIKMHYSFDTLMGLAQTVFDQDPLSGHLFLFFNHDRNRVKILFWDQDGFCIWYKRLESGTFQLPEAVREEQGEESRRILHLYADSLIPVSQQNVASARANYDVNRTSFLDLAITERQLIELRSKQQEALASYYQRIAVMERTIGGSLPSSQSGEEVPTPLPQ